jgi:hypothetical protein
MRHRCSLVLPLLALATLAASSAFGPPRVTVREVSGTPPTPGAVLEVLTEHHTDEENPQVTARAIAQRGSERLTRPITMTRASTRGRYGVAKQWDAGTAWVLVFTVKQGDHGEHGTAEALVKVDASGRFVSMESAMERNERGDRYPRALRDAEIEQALASLRGGR